jgi:acetolactate synthase-1/2/3 large subunit
MKKTGAYLVVKALEEIGVTHTFGIPGVHNTEIYDTLNSSDKITPILVTHEMGAAFMADAISRTSDTIGTLVIVPAAGMTHALSGIGEAYLAGVPMMIISGGIRTDTGKKFQLHEVDQMKILEGITKKSYRITSHSEIIPTIYEAYTIATSGNPGPVFIEVPVNIQLFKGEIDTIPHFTVSKEDSSLDLNLLEEAIDLIKNSKKVGLFLGWGARDSVTHSVKIAEYLNAPVATTLQGLSVFPGDHPLHTGMGFGNYSVPAAEEAFKDCDCIIAVGTKFSEIPTGSFGMVVPENLIHIDICPDVFSKNYPAKVAIHSDANLALGELYKQITQNITPDSFLSDTKEKIARFKKSYREEWSQSSKKDIVNPSLFFESLRKKLKRDDILIADDGNHTFLTAELYPVYDTKCFLSPTDFNAMGYCVPATIGAKFANPDKTVVGIVGDGAFLMTGLELITAVTNKIGVIIFIFHDGELSQISQGQKIPYSRKTCTVMGEIHLEGVAIATGCEYLSIENNEEIDEKISEAIRISNNNQPVIVDINIDYSKKTRFTKGIVVTNLERFPFSEKFRFISRAIVRKILPKS